MKKFMKVAAQGEMLIMRVEGFNEEADKEVEKDQAGNVILAHSETGHHHVVDGAAVMVREQTKNVPEGVGILQMIVSAPTEIKHLRGYDTHEPIFLTPGNYQIRLQREYTPEGYRRVAD